MSKAFMDQAEMFSKDRQVFGLDTLPDEPESTERSAAPSAPLASSSSPELASPLIRVKEEYPKSFLSGRAPEKSTGQERFREFLNSKGSQMRAIHSRAFQVALRPVPATNQWTPPSSAQTHLPPTLPGYLGIPAQVVNQTRPSYAALGPNQSQLVGTTNMTNMAHAGIMGNMTNLDGKANDSRSSGGFRGGSGSLGGVGVPRDTPGRNYVSSANSELSRECQKRRFNPSYKMSMTPDNLYRYIVSLNGHIIVGDGSYENQVDAKLAISKKALAYVRTLPVPPPPPLPLPPSNGNAEARRASEREREIHMESRQLLRRIYTLYGDTATPALSSEVLLDPILSRTFLEGFALGSRVAGTAPNQLARRDAPDMDLASAQPRVQHYRGWDRDRDRGQRWPRRDRSASPVRGAGASYYPPDHRGYRSRRSPTSSRHVDPAIVHFER